MIILIPTLVILIGICLFITLLVYLYRGKQNKAKKTITITLGNSNASIEYEGEEYGLNITKFNFSELAFTRYYSDFKEQTIINYLPGIGFVLTDEANKPKYYYEDEIYISLPGSNVTGYIDGDTFYALHR